MQNYPGLVELLLVVMVLGFTYVVVVPFAVF